MKNAIIFMLLGIILASGVFFLISRSQTASQTKVAISPTSVPVLKAKVVYLTGTAWKIVNDRKIEIKENDVLTEKDSLVTDKDSRLVLNFDDGSSVRLSSETEISLAQLVAKEMIIDEKKGVLFARVNKDSNHRFLVKAGELTIESLGTAFAVSKDEQVTVQVFESKIKVVDKDKNELAAVESKETWNDEDKEVTKLSDTTINKDKFLAWSLSEEVNTLTATNAPETEDQSTSTTQTQTQTTNGNITLTGSAVDNGIKVNWEVNGIDISKGFKVVKNLSGSPVYPGDYYVYFDDADIRSYVWEIKDGKEWHLRVCQYLGDKCGVYSNEIVVKAPLIESSKESSESKSSGSVTGLSLSLEKDGNTAKLSWNVDGSSSQGFKVVWSTNSGPTYPCRDGDKYHYLSNSGARNDKVEGLESGKTYYFRVCEYLGGKCGFYSNEISQSF